VETFVKVAERSFQEFMPNSPLLLSFLCFDARFLQESRLIKGRFILVFLQRCVLLPWQRGWLETRLTKWFFFIKKIQSLDFCHYFPTTN